MALAGSAPGTSPRHMHLVQSTGHPCLESQLFSFIRDVRELAFTPAKTSYNSFTRYKTSIRPLLAGRRPNSDQREILPRDGRVSCGANPSHVMAECLAGRHPPDARKLARVFYHAHAHEHQCFSRCPLTSPPAPPSTFIPRAHADG